MTTTDCITTPQIKSIDIAGRTYRYGPTACGYFIRETKSGKRLDFYSTKSLNWFINEMVARAEELEPEPTPAPVLIAERAVAACADRKESKVKLTKLQKHLLKETLERGPFVIWHSYSQRASYNALERKGFVTIKSVLPSKSGVAGYIKIAITPAGRAALASDTPKTTACAMRTPEREHRIAVKNGEMSRELTIAAAVSAYTRKYGYAPSLIKLHSNPLTSISDFGNIPVEYSDAIPAGRVWLGDR